MTSDPVMYCGACGSKIPPGSISCVNALCAGQPAPQRFPFVCPKCDGEGTVGKVSRVTNPTVLNCPPCGGTGVVWGPVS